MHDKYPCGQFLRIAEKAKAPAMSILWETFGDSPECARRFFDKFKDRETFLQIHFSNEVCRKDNRCIDNAFPGDNTREYNKRLEEFSPATEAVLHARLQKILAFVAEVANPNTFVVLGGGLEDKYSRTAWQNLGGFLYFNTPFAISRNPSGGSKNTDYAAAVETHSTHARPSHNCVANEDGNLHQTSAGRKRFFSHYKDCLAVFSWNSRSQGYVGSVKPPHKERTFVITDSDVKKLGDILKKAPQ